MEIGSYWRDIDSTSEEKTTEGERGNGEKFKVDVEERLNRSAIKIDSKCATDTD